MKHQPNDSSHIFRVIINPSSAARGRISDGEADACKPYRGPPEAEGSSSDTALSGVIIAFVLSVLYSSC